MQTEGNKTNSYTFFAAEDSLDNTQVVWYVTFKHNTLHNKSFTLNYSHTTPAPDTVTQPPNMQVNNQCRYDLPTELDMADRDDTTATHAGRFVHL